MASNRGFALGLGWRVILLVGAVFLFGLACVAPHLVAARIVAGLFLLFAIHMLWRHVDRTNRDLTRFVEGLSYGDFSQGFAGYDQVGAALAQATRRLRDERARFADECRVQTALAEEAPAALLTIDSEGRVTLANKASRKLFSHLPGTRVEDFAAYGTELVALLGASRTATRKLVPIRVDGVVQRAMVSRTEVVRIAEPMTIVSVQPIQHELSAVELAAQADLVRVLTHEIMNSMTPVVSLAESAARIVAGIDKGDDPDMTDARAAIETLARRAAGIMHFVETYRAFSRAPVVDARRFAARPWAEELCRLFSASEQGRGVVLDLEVTPGELIIDADPDLLAQVILNLLKNGAEASAAIRPDPRVALTIGLLPGSRARISVSDNGPGIAPELADEIFLPFFITKTHGTGVGLSLARRIMVAHGGSIALVATNGEGACFELVV